MSYSKNIAIDANIKIIAKEIYTVNFLKLDHVFSCELMSMNL